MRITLVSQLPPPLGGVTTHTRNLALDLTQAGHEVSVVDMGNGMELPRVFTQRCDRSIRKFYGALRELLPRSDVVHFHSSSRLRPLLAAFPLLTRTKVPVVLSIHSGQFHPRRATAALCQPLFRRTNAVLTMSASQRKAVVTALPFLDAARVHVVSPFIPRGPRPAAPSLGGTHILVSGLWAPVYWYEHALQVIDAVRARGYNVRLALAASSASADERCRETIRATCRNIAWVDVLEDVALQDLFPQVCCVLRTTRADSFGLVVAEALWQGIPAVATNVCSRPAGALTFSPGDTQGAVAAVISVLQDPGAAAEAALHSVVPSGTEDLTHLYRSLATR